MSMSLIYQILLYPSLLVTCPDLGYPPCAYANDLVSSIMLPTLYTIDAFQIAYWPAFCFLPLTRAFPPVYSRVFGLFAHNLLLSRYFVLAPPF